MYAYLRELREHRDVRGVRRSHHLPALGHASRLGFGGIVASETEAPNMLTDSRSVMKWMGGGAKRQCDRALRPPPAASCRTARPRPGRRRPR
jgi:hypothetical protein